MKQGPVHRDLGTKVLITDESLQNIVNGNRGIHANPSDAFVEKARDIHAKGLLGEVTRQFLPDYEVNVTFVDGQTLQMKDNWIEPAFDAMVAGRARLVTTQTARDFQTHEPIEGVQFGKPIKQWGNSKIGLHTAREITIEDYRGLGKVVVPKGTRVTLKTAMGNTDGSWFFIDDLRFLPESMAKHDATFYGIRVEVNDVEPIVSAVPE